MTLEKLKQIFSDKETEYDQEALKVVSVYKKLVARTLNILDLPVDSKKTIVCLEKEIFENLFTLGELKLCKYSGEADIRPYNPFMEERNIFSVEGSKYFYHTLVMIPVTEINSICIPIVVGIEPISDDTYLVDFNNMSPQSIGQISDNELDNEELKTLATVFEHVLEHYLNQYSAEDSYKLQMSEAITYFVI